MTFPEPLHGRLDVLPITSLNWKGFEQFSLELVAALPDVASAALYGGAGDKQDGIDILAKLVGGGERTYQCKKYAQFGPARVTKAVTENTYKNASEHVLLVACATTRAAQDEVAKHPGWTMLDQQGISSLVRSLEIEVARRLVENHFGTPIRRAFLGGGTTTFVEPAVYFQPFVGDGLFRHTWSLAGRDDELDELASAVDSARVVVLPGRGGIGKSRLLRALVERLNGRRVLFTLDDVPITAEAAEDLPFTEVVVVVDDAHRRDGLERLLAEAARRSSAPLRVVMATRPQALEELRSHVARAGFGHGEVRWLAPLPDLSSGATEDLARQALGPDHAQYAEVLAEATRDCPLVTVVGGQLLAARTVEPALLEREDDFRYTVLSRWSDELIGRLGAGVDPDRARGLLRVVAALAPLSIEDEPALSAVADELAITVSDVLALLGKQEEAGLLVARGRLRRIVPDVLADHVLHVACLDAQGRPTGYANDLVRRYGASAFERLLRNLAELDWRIGETVGAPVVLDDVWSELTTGVAGANAPVRASLLAQLKPSAVYAPARVIEIVRICLALPPPNGPLSSGGVTDAEVRAQIPALLARIGIHSDYVAEAMAILWELGRDMPGPLHSRPEHPIRLVHELGTYRMSPRHTRALLDLATGLLDGGEADVHLWSPLTLLEPLVARSVDATRSEGLTLHLDKVFVVAEVAAGFRRQVFALISGQAREGSPRTQKIAADLIAEALRPPEHVTGTVPADQTGQWREEEQELVTLATALIASGPPLVAMTLRKTLQIYTDLSPWPDVQPEAQKAIGLPVSDDERMLAVFSDPWHVDGGGIEESAVAVRAFGEHLAELPGSDEALAVRLDDALATLDATADVQADPRKALHALATHAPDRAVAIAEWLFAHPDRPLARFAGAILSPLRTTNATELIELLQALDDDDPARRRQLADYLAWGAWFVDPTEQEIVWMRQSVRDADLTTRSAAIHALPYMSTQNEVLATELALEADTSASQRNAEMVDHVLSDRAADLPIDALDGRLDALATEPRLGWANWNLLVKIGAEYPDRVLGVLIARAEHHTPGFDAVPYHRQGDVLSGLDEAGYRGALDRVLETAAANKGILAYQIAQLFWALDRDEGLSLETLDPWLTGPDEARCNAAVRVLVGASLGRSHAKPPGWQLLTDRPDYAARVLAAARAHGAARLERVMSGLAALIIGGGGSRSIGTDDEQKVQLIARATELRNASPSTGPAHLFWTKVIRSTTRDLDRDRLEDEELEGVAGWL